MSHQNQKFCPFTNMKKLVVCIERKMMNEGRKEGMRPSIEADLTYCIAWFKLILFAIAFNLLNTGDPWITGVWIVQIYSYVFFFSITICIVFHLWLGVCKCRGPAVCTDVPHFIYETWVSADFGSWEWSWNQFPTYPEGQIVLGEPKVTHKFLTAWGIGTPTPTLFKGKL